MSIKLKANPRVCTFADVEIGELFRILRPDRVSDSSQELGYREVVNDGLYAKCGATVAVDVAHNNKDIIPSFKVPCRVMPKLFDLSHLESYKICNNRP